jgi:signal transduction histidine kinase
MRATIRNQILIPLLILQSLAVATATVISAWQAARRSEHEIADRLNDVAGVLEQGGFPRTDGVLARMHGLSGAHFLVYGGDGKVEASSFATAPAVPGAADLLPATYAPSVRDAPMLAIEGTSHFAIRLGPATDPRGRNLLILYPEARWRQARWEAALPPLILGASSLALMAAVSGWVADRIRRRIRAVEQQVARIAEGDFRAIGVGPSGDEVDELARSVNRMSDQLRQSQRTILATERARLLAQLTAGMAHQLRNALTGMRMSLQLHIRRSPPCAREPSLEIALRQMTITAEQIQGLLRLGHAEPFDAGPCDVVALLDEVEMLVAPACEHAGVRLGRNGMAGPLEIRADAPALRGALLNLALNAIEAAGPGGRVELDAAWDEEAFSVRIGDNGPGPPPALAESLCEPFVTGKPEGIGLGLTLAKRVAEAHGGRLAWDRRDGETSFRLTLPRNRKRPDDGATASPT